MGVFGSATHVKIVDGRPVMATVPTKPGRYKVTYATMMSTTPEETTYQGLQNGVNRCRSGRSPTSIYIAPSQKRLSGLAGTHPVCIIFMIRQVYLT